jgi:methyl-accepting chemotaxis protein
MSLRSKLLIPTLLAVLAAFSAYCAFQVVSQNRKAAAEMKTYVESLSALVVASNASYVWDIDKNGLAKSLETLLKDPQIAGIEISDSSGNSLAKVEESPLLPTIQEKEAEIQRDGQAIGKAKIAFTDHYVRAKYDAAIRESLFLMVIIFAVIAATMTFISQLVTKPLGRITAIMKDMAEGEADLTARIPVRGNDEVA